MKVLIIEDESRLAQKIKGYLEELRPEWEIVDILAGVKESILYFREYAEPDLVFLEPDPGAEVFVSQGKVAKLKKWLSF